MKTTIALLRDYKDEDKLAPQCKVVLDVLKAKAGGLKKPLERQDLIKAITDSGKLTTRQDVGRVISFYQPRLIEDGIIDVVKVQDEVKEKPAKAGKPSEPGTKGGAKAAK